VSFGEKAEVGVAEDYGVEIMQGRADDEPVGDENGEDGG